MPVSRDVNRIEAFSDAVFGFALTLLVVSLEVPRTFGDMMASVRALPAFPSLRHLPGRLARLRELDGRASVRVRGQGTEFDSLREYAAQYQIDGRRLRPNQLLMHPGPVNRGVELAAEVIDSPQALIVQQVESGVVVRMAVLYELLAGAGPDRRRLSAGGVVLVLLAGHR